MSFETAQLVFEDPHQISMLERIEDNEERWQTIGMAGGLILLLVVHTFRGEGEDEVIRIISARKATPRERTIYENQAF